MNLAQLHHTTGWGMILLGLLIGSGLGLFIHRDDFLGGYTSFRRRLVRLGHIALIALGMLNILFAHTTQSAAGTSALAVASRLLLLGSLLMPVCCFLTAWKKGLRHGFVVPVLALVAAVVLVLIGGMP